MKKTRTQMPIQSERFLLSAISVAVLAVQLLLPLAPLFADELTPAPDSNTSEQLSNTSEEEVIEKEETEVQPESETEELPSSIPTETDQSSEDSNESVASLPEIIPAEEVPLNETPSSEVDPVPDQAPAEDTENEEINASSTETETPLPTVDEEETPVPDEVDPPAPEPEETEEPESHIVVNDENRFSFGIDDCAQVADGSFYCNAEDIEAKVLQSDRIFAGPDSDGDSEIFIERNEELFQLTHNHVDDAAPYYDSVSNTVVWHRLVGARYQIVSYDFETERETVLTNDHYNNMQPTRIGEITAWQGWVGNDWDILMSDGKTITMLTDNQTHDIGPRINDGYVIWQSAEENAWKVRVYTIATGKTETIADAEGVSIENPRFVLLYDAKGENGDIETRGYDLERKKNVPLHAAPQKLPDELPDPDQTGEDRALIAPAAQVKPKTDDENDPGPDISSPPDDDSEPGDIVIPQLTSTSTPPASLDIPDLIIEPFTQPVPDAIEDLVVPSFAEDDPQDDVATST